MKRIFILALVAMFAVVGCKKQNGDKTDKDEKAKAEQTEKDKEKDKGEKEKGDKEGAADKGDEKAAKEGGDVTCKALVTHMEELRQNSDQKDKASLEPAEMIEMCEKSGNIGDHQEAAKCLLAAKDIKAAQKCEGQQEMMQGWIETGSKDQKK